MFEAQLDAAGGPTPGRASFSRRGARYVVLVTKHHDGYTLWPSEVANPEHGTAWHATRDVVGELVQRRARPLPEDGPLLLGRHRLDLGAAAVSRPLLDALRLTPPQPEYAALRRRALARAHPPLPAGGAVERHRRAGAGRTANSSSATTTPRSPTAWSTIAGRRPGDAAPRLPHRGVQRRRRDRARQVGGGARHEPRLRLQRATRPTRTTGRRRSSSTC